jgi:RNA polymerase sigma-70 factor, ECF subfamily
LPQSVHNPTRPSAPNELIEADLRVFERMRAGDTAALLELYDRHGGTLYALIVRIAGDGAPAAQILEDVLVRIWTGADAYDSALGTPHAWLIGLARHRAFTFRREHSAITAAATGSSAASRPPVLAREEQGRVAAALESLPSPARDLIEYTFFGGFSVPELAVHLHMSEQDVRSGLRLGLRVLAERLAVPDSAHGGAS